MNKKRFSGLTVLITGAAGGIGTATAKRFIDEGVRVVLIDLDQVALDEQCEILGSQALAFRADVSDEGETRAVFETLLARVGRVDIAVLNAGIEGSRAELHVLPVQEFDRVMAVNVRGVFLWLSALLGHMRMHSGGVITITSSTGGLRGAIGMAPYITSKHAVVGLMKTAALEGAAFGIRVNTIHPGPIDTRMMQSIDSSSGDLHEVRQNKFKSIPLHRYGTPEEVAAITAFLSSDEASFCTGSSYMTDGGIMAGSGR
jgi:NAD(P)-dependent dehydrogenase (short-subunit alcohol dehydrogenase family)